MDTLVACQRTLMIPCCMSLCSWKVWRVPIKSQAMKQKKTMYMIDIQVYILFSQVQPGLMMDQPTKSCSLPQGYIQLLKTKEA
jgi:hypothetical protein